MKIAINTQLLIKNKLEGIGLFTYETLKIITHQHPEHEFLFIFDRPFDSHFIFGDNVTPIVVAPPSRHPLLWYLRFEHLIPKVLKKNKVDLFFSPDGWSSVRTKVKTLTVIHDLNFVHHPTDSPFLNQWYFKHYFVKYAQKSTRVVTVSEYSKQDIVTTYKVDAGKVDVVYNGAGEAFKPITELEKETTKKQFSQATDYFLFVGALHPRKNITRLFQAFDEFKRSSASKTKLVLVGEKYWWTSEMEESHRKMVFKTDVIFTGRLPADQLSKVMASALALVYIPYFEGFGIPIIEAMQCHVPVITSNITSMPEVSGDAALLVDPFSIDSIKNAMTLIEKDASLRASLIEKGSIRAKNFSWNKTANLLWQSIEKCLKK